MPITSAARRASLLSSMVQQPRAPERYDAGLRESARWMPVTSWPASTARAAATAESTPPDMAATTFMDGASSACCPGPFDDGPDRGHHGVDVGCAGGVTEGEPQRVARLLLVAAHRQQHVRGLGYAGGAGRPGRALDAVGVEQHQQRVALAAGEAEGGVPGQPLGADRGAVEVGVGDDLGDPADQVVAERRHPGGVLVLHLDGVLDRGRETGDRRDVEGAAADVTLLAAAVHQRTDRQLTAYEEGAHAVGPAHL